MATPTSSRSRRPKFTQAEINSQLQQLFLFSSLSSSTSSAVDGGGAEFTTSSNSSIADLDQLAPILINISKSCQQEAYLRSLKSFVKDKESEIEKICFENYQDFVGSVSQLLRVRQGTVSLKHRVIELNSDVQESGKKVLDIKKQLLQARKVGQNIDEAIDTLQSCLKVLDLSKKIGKLIENEKFFQSLRELEDLQQIHLKPVLYYPFASQMLQSLPSTKMSIKTLVTKSLKTWMFEAREASRSVGKTALENMESRNRRWNSRKRKDVLGGMRLAKINGPVELGVSERYEFNPLENDKVSIDFKPLYTCIHIYTSLDLLQELQLSYQADRRAQAYLLLSTSSSSSSTSPTPQSSSSVIAPPPPPSTSSQHFSLPNLSVLLEEIVGFFIIEAHVLKTTTNFRSEQDVESLWEQMCDKLISLVETTKSSSSTSTEAVEKKKKEKEEEEEEEESEEDPKVFLELKFKVLTLLQTLEGYGYSVSSLNQLLLNLFSRYSKLLERKFSGDFEQIVLDDDHQPMVVNDLEEFEKVVSVSWLPDQGEWSREELIKPGFPLALPFSQTYPLCCIDIRSFTEQFYQFSEGGGVFDDQLRDVDEVLRKALDNLLIKQVSENVQRRLTRVTNLSQLAQIVINLLFFKTACQSLETLLINLRSTLRGGVIHLSSLKSFNTTLVQTQDRIVSQISLKIDSFFEEAEYPWTSTNQSPPPGEGEASSYLMDLMDFVSTVMMSSLIQLPEFSKEYVYKGCLKYCNLLLTSFLTDKEPRMISDQGLIWFEKDLKWLINHVKSTSNNSDPSSSTLEVFDELSQTLYLLTSHSTPTSYLDPQIRQSPQFNKINPKTLKAVLIKLCTFYNSNNSSSRGGGGMVEMRRKVMIEELLRGISR
ncbi:hypothetical protein JCM3765_007693 [Sporobolomyces pararoseus]